MPASLLDSQFATLEPSGPDENPVTVSIDPLIDRIVQQIAAVINPDGASSLANRVCR